jgi:alpha-D-ribose 1-methylphosphonate 5-phosphate C-P lyase
MVSNQMRIHNRFGANCRHAADHATVRNLDMKTIVGTSNRIIEINLSTGQVVESQVTADDRRDYLGGKGLGLKLLYDRMDRGD